MNTFYTLALLAFAAAEPVSITDNLLANAGSNLTQVDKLAETAKQAAKPEGAAPEGFAKILDFFSDHSAKKAEAATRNGKPMDVLATGNGAMANKEAAAKDGPKLDAIDVSKDKLAGKP